MTRIPLSRPGDPPFDRWTLVHIASGVGLGLLGTPWWLAVALLVVYEVFEAVLRRRRSGGGVFEHESLANILADIAVGLAGWAVAKWAWWGHL